MKRRSCTIRVIAGAALLMPFWSEVNRGLAASPEVRGTWLTTTGVDHIKSGANTGVVMNDLRNIGLNTVYVETWKNGYSNYPSPTLDAIPNAPDRSTFLGSTRDLVQETSIQAHRKQLNYVGWFEYGLMSEYIGTTNNPANPLSTYMKNNGWLLKDQAGNYGTSSQGFAWMNPAVPQVRSFLINVVLDAVNRYDLDGIQFDDHMGWPKDFGWDATTASLYLAETGRALPTGTNASNDSNFRAWRQSKVTQFATELSQAVRAARPNIMLSLSPSIVGWSDTQFNATWTAWHDQGLFDEYVPQAYRSTLSAFNSIIDAQTDPFTPDDLGKEAIGISINTSPTPTFSDIQGMIQRSRSEGTAGHVLWYSAGSRDLYGSQLTSFYDVAGQGRAANPHFGDARRPAPVVGSLVSAGTWSFNVTNPGRYRVVSTSNNTIWSEFTTSAFNPGAYTINVPGATQVELLVDHRPFATPDFNGDSVVDLADFLLWRKTLGSTWDLRADADGSGIIDQNDYTRWRAGFGNIAASGASLVSPAGTVPEPTASCLMTWVAVWLGSLRRRSRRAA